MAASKLLQRLAKKTQFCRTAPLPAENGGERSDPRIVESSARVTRSLSKVLVSSDGLGLRSARVTAMKAVLTAVQRLGSSDCG